MTLTEHAASEGYRCFAPFYDAYTEHPGYATWIRGLAGLAREHGGTGPRLLDVACGTGKSLAPLLEDDDRLEAVGVDAVEEMIEVARRRLGDRVALHVADMTRLPVLGAFDVALCANDAMNCLLSARALARALTRIAANLRLGGILVFDTNTPVAFRDHFAVDQTRERDRATFRWKGTFDGTRAVAELDVMPRDRAGDPPIRSLHIQHHHLDEDIDRGLRAAGLDVVWRYGQNDDGSRSPVVDASHFKVIHVVRKRTVHPPS